MGRWPMAQPPGRATRAYPVRASSGPITRTEARMRLSRSVAEGDLGSSAQRVRVSPSRRVDTPQSSNMASRVCTSVRSGTCSRISGSRLRRLAHISGSTAFLAEWMFTSPDSCSQCRMRYVAIISSPFGQIVWHAGTISYMMAECASRA